jgi:hypothetical protein
MRASESALTLRRHRGLLIATLLAVAIVAWRQGERRVEMTRFRLPSFDAYVYTAMAENPAVFSVAPWGYRLLTPLLAHALPGRALAQHFRQLTAAGLVLASLLLYLWLRRLGFGELPALAGVVAFGLSAPVGAAVRQPFLAEPVTLALVLAFLLALEARAPLGVLALLLGLGALAKEIALVSVLVLVARRLREGGVRAALRDGAAVVAPALAVLALLRLSWAPHLGASAPALDTASAPVVLLAMFDARREWLPPLLLGGVLPLAAIGALCRAARSYLADHGLPLALLLALPFGASAWTGAPGFAGFFAGDVPRLLVYALPLLLPLALLALARIVPALAPATAAPRDWPRWAGRVAAVVAVLGIAALAPRLDRYRRADLGGARDGPLLLAVAREGRRVAERLAQGGEVVFDPTRQRFLWGVSEPEELGRMRWFLREGFGPLAHYGIHEIRMREGQAELLLPCLAPRDMTLGLTLAADHEARLRIYVNGRPVGDAAAAPEGRDSRLTIPAAALFRGDNRITLVGPGPQARIRLLSLSYGP